MAAPDGDVITPMRRGYGGNGFLRAESNSPSAPNFAFSCSKASCGRPTKALFAGTIFEETHLEVSTVLKLIFAFAKGEKLLVTSLNAHVSVPTIVEFNQKLRGLMGRHLADNRRLIGGPGRHVEVDESHLFKRKNNQGRRLAGGATWVVGGICRETGEVFGELTEVRDIPTLNDIIQRNVAPGTTIFTDGWQGYNQLAALPHGYHHGTVNHKTNFLNPDDPSINTQRVERLWRTLKQSIPSGTRKEDTQEYLDEFLYFKRFEFTNPFEKYNLVLEVIREYYPIN